MMGMAWYASCALCVQDFRLAHMGYFGAVGMGILLNTVYLWISEYRWPGSRNEAASRSEVSALWKVR